MSSVCVIVLHGACDYWKDYKTVDHSTHLQLCLMPIFVYTELDQVFTEEISRRLQIILVSIK